MNFNSEKFHDLDEAWLTENVSILQNKDSERTEKLNQKPLKTEENNKSIQKSVDTCSDTILLNIKTEPESINQYNDSVVNQLVASEDLICSNASNQENMLNSTKKLMETNPNSKIILVQDEASEQFYQILISLPDDYQQDNLAISNDLQNDEKSLASKNCCFTKCTNCAKLFNETSFKYHVCDYAEPIASLDHPKNKKLKERLIRENNERLPWDPPCIRLLRENIARLRKFIKDELKIDFASSGERNLVFHECTLCEKKFVHATGLARHMEKHAMEIIPHKILKKDSQPDQLLVMTKCLVCGRLFFKTKTAMNHLFKDHQKDELSENNKSKLQENYVGDELTEKFVNLLIENENQKFLEKEETNEYIDMEYLDVIIVNDVLQCEFCEYIFCDCSHLLLHSACHDPSSGFACFSCEIQLPTSKEIFIHWQAECIFFRELIRDNFIIKRYYTCNVCENKFLSLEQLTDHRYMALHFFPRRKHISQLLIIGCEYCGSIFEKIEDLVCHREEKHLKKLIEKKCINIVQSKDLGTTTQKVRQYLCDICGKSYTQSSHLWQHLRFHKGIKPYACKEPNCKRTFTIRPDLNDHIRKCHTGERPYQCQICGKRFLTGSVYYQHRLIHLGDRRYSCEECGKRFYRADALKNHLRIHTGEKPYGCLYCVKHFRQRGDREKHIRARHANLDENAKNVLIALKNHQTPPPQRPSHDCFLAPMPFMSSALFPEFEIKTEDVVSISNVSFPSSMFKPILKDIDG